MMDGGREGGTEGERGGGGEEGKPHGTENHNTMFKLTQTSRGCL